MGWPDLALTRRMTLFLAMLLCAITLFAASSMGLSMAALSPQTINSPASVASWNPSVSCSATLVTIQNILGTAYPNQALAGSPYQTSRTTGGIPSKRALSPPCTITNIKGKTLSSLVEIDKLTLHNYFYETRDCSTTYNAINGGGSYSNGETLCDSTGNTYAVGTSSGYVHVEFDRDWMAAGHAGPSTAYDNNNTIAQVKLPCTISSPCSSTVSIDVQGFVYWDPEGHWELHPFTSWRFSSSATPLSASFTWSPTSPQVGQQVTFTASASGGTSPYTFSWTFGDGSSATGSIATHTYASSGTFTVNLTAQDSGSPQQTATSQQLVTVTSAPSPLTATFTYNPTSPVVGQTVTFAASASGGTTPYSFTWNLGDSSSGTGSSITHAYQSAGTFTVTLAVKDSSAPQQSATSQQSVTVNSPLPLSASFTFNPASPDAGQSVSFTGSASGGISPYSYSWNFGDGSTVTGQSASHAYSAAGTYTATLTIADSAGHTAQSSATLTVNTALSASFTYSPSNPLPLEAVTFSASASGGSQPYSYSWDFGDGSTGTGASVVHSYTLPGTYAVTLTVTDANGQIVATSQTVTVLTSLV